MIPTLDLSCEENTQERRAVVVELVGLLKLKLQKNGQFPDESVKINGK
jgi:hypothetical protein